MAVRIRQLAAPPEITSRLREMGLGEDQEIRLVSRQTSVICQVCNARLAISAQLAEKIYVEPLSAAPMPA
jgi:Fe2+ transport system protein FeoA